jgi:phospholipid/cholesterol/gamma-HCH transport system substrate-binding protein
VGDLGTVASALTPAVSELRPGATALGAATPDLRAVLRGAPPLLGKVPGVAEVANPAVDGLTAALRDARPLAPSLGRTVSSAGMLLGTLAPYAPELDVLLDRLASAVSQGDHNGKWIRVVPMAEPDSQTPGFPPGVRRNPYPAPGEAATDGRDAVSPGRSAR